MIASIFVFWPILGAIFTYALGRSCQHGARFLSLFFSLTTLLLAFSLCYFKLLPVGQHLPFLGQIGVSYEVLLDSTSALLIILSALLCVICVMAGWSALDRWHVFGALLLLFLGALNGVFVAHDLMIFFIFWELMLIPMYFMISQWGDKQAPKAAMRFLLFTVTGSILMLLALIALAIVHAKLTTYLSFSLQDLVHTSLTGQQSFWIGLALLIGLGVKVPLFPLHLWAPATYRAAHPLVTVLLAGAMANAGVYGLLKFVMPLLGDATTTIAQWGAVLAAVGTLYCALLAFHQKRLSEVMAYSSVSHMNLTVLGIFSYKIVAFDGVILQLLAHGLSIAALFLVVFYLRLRQCSDCLQELGGLFKPLPVLGGIFLLFLIASVGMPGMGNFSGEIMIFSGSYLTHPLPVLLAVLSIILGVMYFLKMYEQSMLGPLANKVSLLRDLGSREIALFAALALGSFWLGIYPQAVLSILHSGSPYFMNWTTSTLAGGSLHVAS